MPTVRPHAREMLRPRALLAGRPERGLPAGDHAWERIMMNRELQRATSLLLLAIFVATGCAPTQPFYAHEDGDLSHYVNVATDIEYPDVADCPNPDVDQTQAPLTLANFENVQLWDLTLEECSRLTLARSQVMRQLGGRVSDNGSNIAQATPTTLTSGGNVVTTFDPALVESGYGGNTGSQFSGTGVEAALSEFDAQLDSSMTWRKNDRPQNFGLASIPGFFAPQFQQDTGNFTLGVNKLSAYGTQFELRNNTNYDQNNNGSRTQPSDWVTNIEAGFTQPFLQGAGVQYNRIAGPRTFQEYNGGFADQIDGVMIARIRTDITLVDFENGVRNLMRDVESAYWELYFAYRDLEARKIGRDSALATWQRVKELERVGGEGGEADKEAQARSAYYQFRAQVETSFTGVLRQENYLRYLMGLPVADGRLIRPIDEPTTAEIHFDWPTIHSEALVRRGELRKQKWTIKRRELELVAARNQMLPRLDAVGRYRWLGAGDELIDSNRNGIPPYLNNSNAFESLTSGDYQEWELGMQFSMPLGFRKAMTEVRHHELLLAHERAILKDMELEVSHQLGNAVRDIDLNYGTAQTNFNARAATEAQVASIEVIYRVGKTTLDQLLDAQRQRAQAESAYYRSLVDYNKAIMLLHYNKGSLLEYNGVYLAEGPWPGKAYFDALRRARQRDASLYIDYGYTRPDVMSRGPSPQFAGAANGGIYQGAVVGEQVQGLPLVEPQAQTTIEGVPATDQPATDNPATGQPEATEPIPAPSFGPQGSIPQDVSTVNLVESLPSVGAGGQGAYEMMQSPEAAPVAGGSEQPAMALAVAPSAPIDIASLLPANPFVKSEPVAQTTPANPFLPASSTELTNPAQPAALPPYGQSAQPAAYETDANNAPAQAAAATAGGAGG